MRTTASRYSFAVFAAVAALLLRQALTPFFGHSNPYHTVWAAVVFSAWYCGLGPALVTTLLSLLGVLYLFLPPVHSLFRSGSPKPNPRHARIPGPFRFHHRAR